VDPPEAGGLFDGVVVREARPPGRLAVGDEPDFRGRGVVCGEPAAPGGAVGRVDRLGDRHGAAESGGQTYGARPAPLRLRGGRGDKRRPRIGAHAYLRLSLPPFTPPLRAVADARPPLDDSGSRMPIGDVGGPSDEGAMPVPYVSPTEAPAEATLKAVGAGILFGILFGAANAYLGLRAGLTISTSIPVAVMTVALFRALRSAGMQSSILEANLSQTVGSASSSVASGVIFTLPALFLWGFDTNLVQITLLAMCGGLLGVLFMIPLRPYLIVREHPNLPYPEGTACAEVLKASEAGGAKAKNVFLGLGVGAAFKALTGWARVVPDSLEAHIPFLRKGQLGSDVSAALFGVGYILGP